MIGLDTSLDHLLDRYPKVAVLLMRHGLLCVACPLAQFHTIEQAAAYHQLDSLALLKAIMVEIAQLYGPSRPLDTNRDSPNAIL